MGMVAEGTALSVAGNHDNKLMRQMQGRNVRLSHGLQESVTQLARETPEFRPAAGVAPVRPGAPLKQERMSG